MKLNAANLKKYSIVALVVLLFIVMRLALKLPLYQLGLAYLLLLAALAAVNLQALVVLAGNYCMASGKWGQAVRIYRWAIAHNAKQPAAYLNYAIGLARDGEAQKALDLLNKAAALGPSPIQEKNILLTKASCYWILQDVDQAIDILEGMRGAYEYVNCHVLATLGYMYIVKGNLAKAEEMTRLALDDYPEFGSAWDNMGQLHFRRGEMELAEQAFGKALSFKNDLVDSHYYMGLIAENNGSPEKAREYFTKAAQCRITALNTVTKAQVEEKAAAYQG